MNQQLDLISQVVVWSIKCQDLLCKRLVLSTTQRNWIYCHKGGKKPENIHTSEVWKEYFDLFFYKKKTTTTTNYSIKWIHHCSSNDKLLKMLFQLRCYVLVKWNDSVPDDGIIIVILKSDQNNYPYYPSHYQAKQKQAALGASLLHSPFLESSQNYYATLTEISSIRGKNNLWIIKCSVPC